MINHGVSVRKKPMPSTPVVTTAGIPFVVGVAPVQAGDPANVGKPVACYSLADAKAKFGYSEDWEKYTLCEVMHSQFELYKRAPVIFCNVMDPTTAKTAVAAADIDVVDHKVLLPMEAINDSELIVAPAGGGTALINGTDYDVYHDESNCIVEVLRNGAAYTDTKLNIEYTKVTPNTVTAADIAAGMEAIEMCMTLEGIVPDRICAPGFSQDPVVSAVMAVKTAGFNGSVGAKALIDIDTNVVDEYEKLLQYKTDNLLTDKQQILCWPLLQYQGRTYHYSTQLAGLMASVAANNGDCPYESPSNMGLFCDAAVTAGGKEILMTQAQANIVNGYGVVTALRFLSKWRCWGNYTACFPENKNEDDCMIPVSDMFQWVGNTFIRTLWEKVDKPLSQPRVNSIVDSVNIWLNSLTGSGYLYGGRMEFHADENPEDELRQGKVVTHNYLAPMSVTQEIEVVQEYDVSYLVKHFAA